jgi:hypothetical protein
LKQEDHSADKGGACACRALDDMGLYDAKFLYLYDYDKGDTFVLNVYGGTDKILRVLQVSHDKRAGVSVPYERAHAAHTACPKNP